MWSTFTLCIELYQLSEFYISVERYSLYGKNMRQNISHIYTVYECLSKVNILLLYTFGSLSMECSTPNLVVTLPAQL